jgi:hypothetical protein
MSYIQTSVLNPYIYEPFYNPGGNVIMPGGDANSTTILNNLTSGINNKDVNLPNLSMGTIYGNAYFGNMVEKDKTHFNNIGNNIATHTELITKKRDINNKHDIFDANGVLNPPNIQDAITDDYQNLLVQENTMYILGIMATATLLITAILIAKE